MSLQFRGNLYLLGAAFLWGTTFVAQMTGMDELGPYSYSFGRYLIGLLSALVIWVAFRGQRARAKAAGTYQPGWKAGLGAGSFMIVGSLLQQVGMTGTTAGKAAFITSLYIVIVPIGAVLLGKHIRKENWAGAAVAIVGLYLLSLNGSFELSFGDSLELVGSFFWAGQILFIDRFASRVDGVELSVAQIFVCMTGSLVLMGLFETPTMTAFSDSWFAIVYGGVMSAGVAFTLQIFGQKYADPGPAAILMSFEAVFGALSGCLLLGEVLSAREIVGCILMLAGALITQAGLFFRHPLTSQPPSQRGEGRLRQGESPAGPDKMQD